MRIALILVLFVVFSCNNDVEQANQTTSKEIKKDTIKVDTIVQEDFDPEDCIDTLEQKLIDYGLVDIQSLDPSILVDVKYASEDNFLGFNMYGKLRRIYLQPDVAEVKIN